MKGKHLHIETDSKLLVSLRKAINQELKLDDSTFYIRLIVKLVFYAGLSIGLYMMMFIPKAPLFFILNYVFLGMAFLLFAFNFAHDFSHNTVFKDKTWNNLGFIFIYALVGAHAEAWRERHVNSHHFAPNVKEYDTDLQITSLIRVTPDMKHCWYHRFQYLYAPFAYATYSLYWIFIKDSLMLLSKIREHSISVGYIVSFLIQKAFYLTLLLIVPLVYSGQPTEVVLIGFLMMHVVQSVFLLFTFFMTHHVLETTYPMTDEKGVIQSSWLMNQIGSSNDMHPFSEVANFLFGGFNNHIAHHLFPHIHHIHYPKMNQILYRILNENGIIPNQTSYFGGAISHLKLLKKLSE